MNPHIGNPIAAMQQHMANLAIAHGVQCILDEELDSDVLSDGQRDMLGGLLNKVKGGHFLVLRNQELPTLFLL